MKLQIEISLGGENWMDLGHMVFRGHDVLTETGHVIGHWRIV